MKFIVGNPKFHFGAGFNLLQSCAKLTEAGAVGGWCDSHRFVKGAIEITDIAVSAQERNFGYFFVGFGEKLAAFDDADAV